MNKLIVQNLGARYSQHVVFHHLDFILQEGHALIVQGKNGVGKSTLLRILSGLKYPTQGHILWNQSSIYTDLQQYQSNIAFLGHLNALKPYCTVNENLQFFSNIYQSDIKPVLQKLGINDLANILVQSLSAGQKRKVALARLLLKPATIWLLDEPCTGLDKNSIENLTIIINELIEKKKIVIIATHEMLSLQNSKILTLS